MHIHLQVCVAIPIKRETAVEKTICIQYMFKKYIKIN